MQPAPCACPRRAVQALAHVGDHLRQMEKDLERLAAAMAGDGRVLKEAAGAIDDEVRRVRMLPFAEACQGLDRMVRDLAQGAGKDVELVLQGGDVELDRSVLEGLKDPLRHLVRNAVDHGAEPAAERRAAGKPPFLRLTVAAVVRGAQVEVAVEDDGRGIDLNALRQFVRKKGLPEPADERELAHAIFLPGLSTSRYITDVSGRGVGLDVVKSRVESLHGTVDLSFTQGRGTRFTLSVPLTLTTLRVLLVGAGGQTFALPAANVLKLVRAEPSQVRSVEGRQMLALGGTPVPLASLTDTLGLRAPTPTLPREGGGSPSFSLPPRGGGWGWGGKVPVVVLAAGEKRIAFVVEEFQAEQEVVIKSLGARIRRTRFISAGTILPSGKIALVLNVPNLVRGGLRRPTSPALAAPADRDARPAKKRILVVDDSLTTRALEKSILEAAGYDVAAAADGAAAWQLLQEQGADLVVSDVDMPRMDGFELTEAVRGSPRFRGLPVVLVTARETESDKTARRGGRRRRLSRQERLRPEEPAGDDLPTTLARSPKSIVHSVTPIGLRCRLWILDYGLWTMNMFRVLVTDDSATARVMLVSIFAADPDLNVVGEARNGLEAVTLTQKLRPDVITMDLHMPLMDGFAATKEIMITAPTPIVIATGSTLASEVATAMHALRAGALAVLRKPPAPGAPDHVEAVQKLVATVKAMAQVKVVRHWRSASSPRGAGSLPPVGVAAAVSDEGQESRDKGRKVRAVAIATSTGGPAALQDLLAALPGDFSAPILVVQHITRGFTQGLSAWLNTVCSLQVKVAEHGERLAPHTVYVAPDDRHLGVSNMPAVVLSAAAPVNGFRPSGTYLFESAAKAFGPSVAALILTGMGDDGVVGLRAVRQAGGRIIAQDEESSVVFGMPGAAVAAGLTDQVLPLDQIAARLVQLVSSP